MGDPEKTLGVNMANDYIHTIEDDLIEILETFGYPVDRQGSYQQGEAYPETFFTFWTDSEDGSHFDNFTASTIWHFDVNIYSRNPDTVIRNLLAAKDALDAAGFITDGKGSDAASDYPTHTGKTLDVWFIERNKMYNN